MGIIPVVPPMRSEPMTSSPLVDGALRSQEIEPIFEVAIICALPLETSTVSALFDKQWDDQSYGKAPKDSNAYSTGVIGHHNVVLVHMPVKVSFSMTREAIP